MGTPKTSAPAVATMVPTTNVPMPYAPRPGAHSVPNKNLKTPISPIAGTARTNKYTQMTMTAAIKIAAATANVTFIPNSFTADLRSTGIPAAAAFFPSLSITRSFILFSYRQKAG